MIASKLKTILDEYVARLTLRSRTPAVEPPAPAVDANADANADAGAGVNSEPVSEPE